MILSSSFSKKGNQGSAVIVVIALLSLLLMFVAGNAVTLHFLGRDLLLIEKKQELRLERYRTNTPAFSLTAAAAQRPETNAVSSAR